MPRILLVEDDPDNTEIVERLLTMYDYAVIKACDGPMGVTLAKKENPDLILMDMKLPNQGDGVKATRAIRGQASARKVPIVALTAQVMPQEVEEMVQAGCDDVVAKPIDFDELLSKIKNLLDRPATSSQAKVHPGARRESRK